MSNMSSWATSWSCQKHSTLAEIEEAEQDVICIDDVIGKEVPCYAVRKAREQELKYLRDFGVDTKWIDTKQSI